MSTVANTTCPRSRRPRLQLSACWFAPLRALDANLFFPLRHKNLTDLLAPHLGIDDSVLDVGSSSGQLARRLMDVAGCRIRGIDVHLQPCSFIPVQSYDGRSFPFDDRSFDGVMMVDMLHHTTHPEEVLREAVRVSRQYVLIKDHYWENRLDLGGLRLSDYIGNAPFGIDLPYNYLQLHEWTRMFSRLAVRVESRSQFRHHPLEPAKNLFVRLAV